jgi:hypothetical protein
MGQTTKAIKDEVKIIFHSVYQGLKDQEKLLTHKEKIELREYLNKISTSKNHSYSYIFIERKIKEILSKRTSQPHINDITYCDDITEENI